MIVNIGSYNVDLLLDSPFLARTGLQLANDIISHCKTGLLYQTILESKKTAMQLKQAIWTR